jgi:hypothetical protein
MKLFSAIVYEDVSVKDYVETTAMVDKEATKVVEYEDVKANSYSTNVKLNASVVIANVKLMKDLWPLTEKKQILICRLVKKLVKL